MELIDGDRLCELLREYQLGVEVRERLEYDVIVKEEFVADVSLYRRVDACKLRC